MKSKLSAWQKLKGHEVKFLKSKEGLDIRFLGERLNYPRDNYISKRELYKVTEKVMTRFTVTIV